MKIGERSKHSVVLVLVFAMLISSLIGGCSNGSDVTGEKKPLPAKSPGITGSVSEASEPSKTPGATENPTPISSEPGIVSPEPTISATQTEPPEPTISAIQTEPSEPSASANPVSSAEPYPTVSATEQPRQTAFPTGVYMPSNSSFFTVKPTFEIIDSVDLPDVQLSEKPFRFEYSSPLILYAATSPGKPSSIPDGSIYVAPFQNFTITNTVFTNKVPKYSNGFRAAFVEKGKDEVLWFAWRAQNSSINKITWQISDYPFSGSEDDWKNPKGLLKSGELSKSVFEFSVDFSKIVFNPSRGVFTLGGFNLSFLENEKINPEQKILYVRAVATDSTGSVVGEPGKGLEILYGERLTYLPRFPQISSRFNLLTGNSAGPVGAVKESYNLLADASERTYQPYQSSPLYFKPEGFPKETDTIYIQVTTSQPKTGYDAWRDPAGLVYEIKLQKGEADFDNLTEEYHAIPVPIKSFVGTPPKIYYVRAVALADGPDAGTVKPSYSKTVIIKYGEAESQFTYYPPPEVIKVDAKIPSVNLIEYKRYRPESTEWMYYYEVVRQPTYGEYFALLPAASVPNSSTLVEDLTPGTVIYLKPKDSDNDSWWEKAKDAISSAFGSLVNFISDITNWVSNAYADLKSGVVKFIAANLPLVPAGLRDDLQRALEKMVDYGLVAIGIPPELPNFDELTNMGVDYLAATALAQAGIPETDLTMGMVKNLSNDLADGFTSAATTGNVPNPMNWNFVRQYPEALYRPSYLLIEVTNPSDKMSPKGKLSGSVYTEISSSEKSDPEIMSLSSGFGGTLYFELYRPVHDIEIPPLLPGQTIQVPVFLQEYTGAAYSFNSHVVTHSDFTKMEKYLGEFTFSFRVNFELPPIDEYVKQKELPPKDATKVYEYYSTSNGFSFTRFPYEDYIP